MTEAGQSGNVLFGPFLELRPGWYEVEFTVTVSPSTSFGWVHRIAAVLLDRRIACVLEVTIHSGQLRLAHRKLSVATLRATSDGRFRLRFEMPGWTVCEFRVFARGTVGLMVQPTRPCRLIKRFT